MAKPVTDLTAAAALGRNAKRDLIAHTAQRDKPTQAAEDRARWRLVMVQQLQALIDQGQSVNAAITTLQEAVQRQALPMPVLSAAANLARRSGCPTPGSLRNWLGAYQQDGAAGLTDALKGRQRKAYGWEARALELYNSPTKPRMSTIAKWLAQEGWSGASYHLVRTYLQSLPATLGEIGPARIGAKTWHGKHTPYVIRDKSVLDVGDIYEGDGHTCDVYVAHPATGKPYRPEWTPWMDVRSNFVVAHHFSDAESGISTLMGLGKALLAYNHVPAAIHTDPGSGFTARIVSGEVVGVLHQLSITHMAALPGNWRGKGLTEGFFQKFEEVCGKRFDTFTSAERSDDALRHLSSRVERGLIQLPALVEYAAAVDQFVNWYNNNPQDALDGQSPAQVFAQLKPVPIHLDPAQLFAAREIRRVSYQRVRLNNNIYESRELARYEGRDVVCEINITDASQITIRDKQTRFICVAQRVAATPWAAPSYLEQIRQKREQGQLKRLQDKANEVKARSRPIIDSKAVEDKLAALESINTQQVRIDILKTDY